MEPQASTNHDIERLQREDRLLALSFASDGDCFHFLGASSIDAINARIELLKIGAIPMLRQPPPPPPTPNHVPPHPGIFVSIPNAPARPPSPLVPLRPPLSMPVGHRPIIVFDTETVGLAPAIVCQMAWVLIENGRITTQADQILRLPRGVKVSSGAFKIHGISTQQCARDGVDASAAIGEFCRLAQAVLLNRGSVVAHNGAFDVRAIAATRAAHEMIDMGNDIPLDGKDVFCTMRRSSKYSTLKTRNGRRKNFKNDELYIHFYGSAPTWANLHSALDDVLVTALNYAKGCEAGWW